MHDGGLASGAFYIHVSDGRFDPEYKIFILTVHPLTLQVVHEAELVLIQGQTSGVLTNMVFNVGTNGNRSAIMYNVTIPPIFGQLYVNNYPVSYFSQENVADGEIQRHLLLTNILFHYMFQSGML